MDAARVGQCCIGRLGHCFAVEDVSGDSATMQYISGKHVVHHGPEYRVLSNGFMTYEQDPLGFSRRTFAATVGPMSVHASVQWISRVEAGKFSR